MPGTNIDWRDVIQEFAYNTFQNASGNCADLLFVVSGGPLGGTYTLAQLQQQFPAQFHDNTCTKDANMDNRPAVATDLNGSNYLAAYTPVNDTVSTGTGGGLTTATSAGTGSTSLPVADATWFPDPRPHGTWTWGAPRVGQWAGAYTIFIEGFGNVTYTDVAFGTYPTVAGTLTLATPATWLSGARVGYSQSAGGTKLNANRGVKR